MPQFFETLINAEVANIEAFDSVVRMVASRVDSSGIGDLYVNASVIAATELAGLKGVLLSEYIEFLSNKKNTPIPFINKLRDMVYIQSQEAKVK